MLQINWRITSQLLSVIGLNSVLLVLTIPTPIEPILVSATCCFLEKPLQPHPQPLPL